MANFFSKLFGKKEVKETISPVKQEKVETSEVKPVEIPVEVETPVVVTPLQNNDVRRLVELGKSWGMLIRIVREDDAIFIDGPKDKVAEAVAAGAKPVDSSLYSVPVVKVIWHAAPAKITECKGKIKKQGLKMVKVTEAKPAELEFTHK